MRLTDEDGLDGPFERAMRRAEREDSKRARDAVASAFASARLHVAELEAKMPEHAGGEWSPAQVCRRAS